VVVVRSLYIFPASRTPGPILLVAKNPASDYGRDLGKLEGGVDVLKNLTFTVIGFLFAIGGGGIFLLTQIYDLKSSLGETKQNVASALERIGKIENAASTIEGAVAELRGGQVAASDALSRIENNIAAAIRGPTSPLQPIATQLLISLDDAQTIRAALKSDPDQAYKNVGKLGDVLTDAKLLDFPADLVAKFHATKSHAIYIRRKRPNTYCLCRRPADRRGYLVSVRGEQSEHPAWPQRDRLGQQRNRPLRC
jgi:hypothetical protein